ncbi:MAG: hypothetical protein AAF944_26630 [Bacteroidota bacterium]
MKIFALLNLFIFTATSAFAQSPELVPFSSDRWKITGEHTLEEYKGQSAVKLTNGRAYLSDVSLKNGIIEYDIAFTSDRGFVGAMFRIQDQENYEEYYMRAHQSGNPDAMQYTPVYNGMAGWQLYHGEGYGTPHFYRFQEWMHVKLVIADQQMEVYIDNMNVPVLHAFELKRNAEAGFVGIYTAGKGAYFANFSFQSIANPPIKSSPKSFPAAEEGTIMQWQVSNAFGGKQLENQTELSKGFKSGLNWQTLTSESSGTVNLGQVSAVAEETNTVIAKVTVDSDQRQIKPLHIGYSDAVTVYVNGKAIYGGQRNFRSRDYRYLGTIGYFDTVYLPLDKGNNEIWFAVTENFGGWGIRARFPSLENISLAE